MDAALMGPLGERPRLRVYPIFPQAPVRALTISKASSGCLLRALTVRVMPTELSTGRGPPAITAGKGKIPRSEFAGRAARMERRIHCPPRAFGQKPRW
jgi:hypothetical protein